MIRMTCPQCAETLELDAGFVGGVARCRHCAAMFTVPANAASETSHVLEGDDAVDAAPPRPKNKAVRAATAAVLVAVLLVVVGGFVGAILFVAGSPTDAERDAAAVARMHRAIEADPYRTTTLNALGLPLGDRAVVVVDADYRSAAWLDAVNAALRHGLTRPSGGPASINLVYTADPLPMMLAAAPVNPAELDAALIDALMQRIEPDATPPLDEAVRLALQFEPASLVIVLGRTLSNDELNALRGVLAGYKRSLRIDVVMIDKDDPGLDELATSTGGLYVPISQRHINAWSAP